MERSQRVIGIARETSGVWERRAPLSPTQVAALVKENIKVIVQPSERRIYSDKDYKNAAAVIQEDLNEATLILGVKPPQPNHLYPDKTYAFLSNITRGQHENMPLLDAILEKKIRLIGYEKMLDDNGRQVVVSAFGKYAGVCGMINILHGIGLRLRALGFNTPFSYIGPGHIYRTSEEAKKAVRSAGREIQRKGLPAAVGPLTFIFTGTGNVSMGAQEIFRELPHEFIGLENLPGVSENGAINKLYGCVISREDYYERKDGGPFDLKEAKDHPELYNSAFSVKIAPYATCIVNGIRWDPKSPPLLNISDAKMLVKPIIRRENVSYEDCPQLPHRFLAICNITIYPEGCIEFIKKATTIESPFCLYDAEEDMDKNGVEGDGILFCAINNLPAQLPRESTDLFGGYLLPYINDMLKSDAKSPLSEFNCSPVIKNSVIASNGSLTDKYHYIDVLRKAGQPCLE